MLQPGILVYLSTCAGQVEPGLPCQATHTEGGEASYRTDDGEVQRLSALIYSLCMTELSVRY